MEVGVAGSMDVGVAGSMDVGVAGCMEVGVAGSMEVGVAGSMDVGVAGSMDVGVAGSMCVGLHLINASPSHSFTAGKEIKAQCMPEAQYHGIFPMAMSAMIPLRPSS